MKAKELRSGVLYAYGQGDYDDYNLVVLLDTETLYTRPRYRRTSRMFEISTDQSPHGAAGQDGQVGYLALGVNSANVTDDILSQMLALVAAPTRDIVVRDMLTLERHVLVFGYLPGTRVEPMLANHRFVRGPWHAVIAERNARRASVAQRRAAEQATRDERQGRLEERLAETTAAFAALGVEVGSLLYDERGLLTEGYILDQETAEKLIERLRGT